MRAKFLVLLILVFVLNGSLISNVSAQTGGRMFGEKSEVITELNYNLVVNPPSLDPSFASDTSSNLVIEQLFIGLVDLDDATSEVKPELATSWTLTEGGTQFDFTLRNDAYWSNGAKITAQDVRYAILRALSPSVSSNYAYVLYPIVNAEAYKTGAIADPNLVGVEVHSDTHLRIILTAPNSQFLSVLGLWVARPLPQTTIDTWGDQWTQPEHIVTSGAYLLKEWVVDDHILLEKNPAYFDAATVQITKVNVKMVGDAAAAWAMYQNGDLDTVAVPYGTTIDPIIQQEITRAPDACTYYYGMNTSLAPFDNPLVRKAFSAAIDRRGLIRTLGAGFPAITFSPQGVFGYVDGYAEGVGLPYDPAQARAYLADAGYPGGVGLPTVTLAFNNNTGHQNIAQTIHDNWLNVLGVDVQLQSYDWADYLNRVDSGEFQIWRLGWCADYMDAYNFLHDGIITRETALGNWNNLTYWNLINQTSLSTDQDARSALFKQAEEILVETDAVVAPLYHYERITATKPYLERTYSSGNEDISTWHITAVTEEIPADTGGTLVSEDGAVQVTVPSGTFAEDVVLIQKDASGNPPQSGLTSTGQVFDISAYNESGDPVDMIEGQTVTMQVSYDEDQINFIHEDTLSLYYWDESTQSWVLEPSTIDLENNIITATPSHFSLWAVIGESYDFVYLPLLTR